MTHPVAPRRAAMDVKIRIAHTRFGDIRNVGTPV
jgi:hypothetical protein